MRIILASKSPRRREILENLGVQFEVMSSQADETCAITDPEALVRELAIRKGFAVFERLGNKSDTVVISADTVVAVNNQILGKPKDADDAHRMLKLLQGGRHKVISGICVIRETDGRVESISDDEVTLVKFDKMTDDDIDFYISTGEPFDKAGAYAIQGHTSRWISGIEGDYFNVVGLPVNLLYKTLQKMGITI